MSNLLEQLKQYSIVVADTGDLAAIQRFSPEDATTNPSLILKAVQSGQYDELVEEVIAGVSRQNLPPEAAVDAVCDQLVVAMGKLILERVPGRVSTEVNARLSFDTAASVEKARQLITLYEQQGIPRSRVLIKLAATWEGIQAAAQLEQEDIQCNLTLIFSFVQARACAEAGAFLISPFVGRILDWYRQQNPEMDFSADQEPGVLAVQRIYQYFRTHGYATIVMGASFRNIGEIVALAGCDRLTISPVLLDELSQSSGSLSRCLQDSGENALPPSKLTEAEFRWQFNDDAMAVEKLAEGIRGFEQDQRKLEELLSTQLFAVPA